jgi:hypothetical protein
VPWAADEVEHSRAGVGNIHPRPDRITRADVSNISAKLTPLPIHRDFPSIARHRGVSSFSADTAVCSTSFDKLHGNVGAVPEPDSFKRTTSYYCQRDSALALLQSEEQGEQEHSSKLSEPFGPGFDEDM